MGSDTTLLVGSRKGFQASFLVHKAKHIKVFKHSHAESFVLAASVSKLGRARDNLSIQH